MELNVKFKVKDGLYTDAIKDKVTVYQKAMSYLIKHMDMVELKDFTINGISMLDEPLVQINIDLHGILKVIGGVSYKISKTESKTLLLVDEGASYLLFRIDDKKAFFSGGLNGTELKRFYSTEPGSSFSYYKRTYRKLPMSEVQKLVDYLRVYYYDTEEVGNPRKLKQ